MKDFSFYQFKQKQIPISQSVPAIHISNNRDRLYHSKQHLSSSRRKIEEQRVLYHAGYQTRKSEPKIPRIMKSRDKVFLAICLILIVFIIAVYYARKSVLKVALGLKRARQVEASSV